MDTCGKPSYGTFSETNNPEIMGRRDRSPSPVSPTSSSAEDVNTYQEQINRSPISEDASKASYYTPSMVDELRKRNRLYFLDPITKLLYFHTFPWKLTLQIFKVVLITAQIIVFGSQRQSIVEFFGSGNQAFKHLLLKDWDPAYETMPYPPATGQYGIYDVTRLIAHINHALKHYHNIPAETLAEVHLNRDPRTGVAYPAELCFKANHVKIFPNQTYLVLPGVIHNCTFVYPEHGTTGNFTYDIEKFVRETEFPIVFNRLLHVGTYDIWCLFGNLLHIRRSLEIELKMYIKTHHLNLIETRYGPSCYNSSVSILYINEQMSGKILVSLKTMPSEIKCENQLLSHETEEKTRDLRVRYIAFDAVVVAFCSLSTILCARSLWRSNKLRRDTADYFKKHRNEPLSLGDQMEFINRWYIHIICNDILTTIGTAFKIEVESRVFDISTANNELCSMLLGLGVLLSYIGLLRYIGFFKSYNLLILILKTSAPHVLRFMVCVTCLFTGFLFCGWTMFSPYNLKFRSLSSTSECMFALVNGDDMYVSFSALDGSSNVLWYANRIYLYCFISLFIYVVISVFIAVIMDNYECIKLYSEGGQPETVLEAFMKEDGEMTLKEVFSHVRHNSRSWQSWVCCIFPCLSCLRSTASPTRRPGPCPRAQIYRQLS